MNDEQLLRYNRQIMLADLDINGQQKLLDSKVLLIGLGGLGAPVAMYLAAAGIGTMVLVDHDVVDLSNLQRQIIHLQKNIGQLKVDSARETLTALNPEIEIITFARKLNEKELKEQVSCADVIIDATDNFESRFLINRLCYQAGKPLVSGAVIQLEGQVSVFPGNKDSSCYQCLYPESGEEDTNCTSNGVLAPLPGIIGSIQATEAIKLISGIGTTLSGRLLLMDARDMSWRELKLTKDPACPVCNS